MEIEFVKFGKIPRLSREVVISEKIDGTNGQIAIGEDGTFLVGSRSRWLSPGQDNYGFYAWATENKDELMKLGPGRHFGEWWGKGIQRGYNQISKRFSLFNTSKWANSDVRPRCCGVVPVLAVGMFATELVDYSLAMLKEKGSSASPGYPYPEGIVVYHTASGVYFKKTIENDESPKGDNNGRGTSRVVEQQGIANTVAI